MAIAELWQRGLRASALEHVETTNRGAAARLLLVELLARAGHPVSLVVVHQWSRERQGAAYLWARAFLEGREDLPPPFAPDGGPVR